MSSSLTIEVPEALAEAWRKLPPEQRLSVVDYASYLAAREASGSLHEVDEAVEAEWDELLNDPQRTARLQRWAEESLAKEDPRPFDPSRL